MKVVLAEKPSVARELATVLKITGKKPGYFEGKGVAVTWAFGHMVELEEPDGYNPAWKRWSLDSLPMIPDTFRVRPRGDEGARKQLAVIEQLFRDAEELVCATDAGREGELIFRYIRTWAGCEEKPFRRLWISSLTRDAILAGFKHLRDGHDFDNLYQAARCRSEADWIVGLNATRFFTVKYGRSGDLWTVGRVQTPVLAMIVGRDREIEEFRPEDYWEVHTLYRETRFKHRSGKITDRAKAEALVEAVRGRPLTITDLQCRTRTFQPPQLHDLTELQRDMNKRWGLTANRTLKAAQSLYEKKHITYPRTDSRYLGTDQKPELPGILDALRAIRAEDVARLDLTKLPITRRVVDDRKVSDHHAIIPTREVSTRLSGDEEKVYEAVVTRFLAVFHPPCLKDQTTVTADVNGQGFKASGTVITDPGWQVLYPHLMKSPTPDRARGGKKATPGSEAERDDDAQLLPAFEKGEQGPHKPELKTLRTKPPAPFTEASLLRMMETAGKMVEEAELREALKERGLGTPATRAAIIETLIGRKYIFRKKKQLLSTEAGRNLIRLIADERLKSPELTGEWEADLKRIEQGQGDPDRFMQQVVKHTRGILTQSGAVSREPSSFGACPVCGGRVIEGKTGYGCSRWRTGCRFVLPKDVFGSRVSAAQATDLLRDGVLAIPRMLMVDGKARHALLVLKSDGSLGWKPAPGLLGACPLCGGDVIEGERGYGCANWRAGCRFVVWKTMSQRRIPKAAVRTLLKDGITPFIQKFKNRQGKRFDARLKLVDGKVEYDYTPNSKPNSKPGADELGPGQDPKSGPP